MTFLKIQPDCKISLLSDKMNILPSSRQLLKQYCVVGVIKNCRLMNPRQFIEMVS